jgi:hypothetical protein
MPSCPTCKANVVIEHDDTISEHDNWGQGGAYAVRCPASGRQNRYPTGRPRWLGPDQGWPCGRCGLEVVDELHPCAERANPSTSTAAMNFRDVQVAAWENKLAKGFNTTDVPMEFCLLQAEVGEAFDAWRKGLPDLAEELADVALFLVSLAEMTGIDLQAAVEAKLAKNAGRTYALGGNGYMVRVDTAPYAPTDDVRPVQRHYRPILFSCPRRSCLAPVGGWCLSNTGGQAPFHAGRRVLAESAGEDRIAELTAAYWAERARMRAEVAAVLGNPRT